MTFTRLTIRRPQMEALKRASQRHWMNRRLGELFPGFAALSSMERKRRLEEGLSRAARFRLSPDDQFAFLCLEQTFGPVRLEDPESEWARQILDDPERDSTQRIRAVKKAALRRLLDEEQRQAALQEQQDAPAEEEEN